MPFFEPIAHHTDRWFGRIPVTIRGGENEGLKWSLVSAGGGYRSGRRASKQMAILSALLRPGDVMWDVGAHHGYMTLCASRRVGPAGQVHAFEPSSRSIRFLKRHVTWNTLGNVWLHPYALGSYDGTAKFGGTGSTKGYSLGGGDEEVQVRRADSMVVSGECPAPDFAKIDVEGAEGDTLSGAISILRPDSRLLVAVHTREADRRCSEILSELGYKVVPSRQAVGCREGDWLTDPDLLCFGPDYREMHADLEKARSLGF